MNVLIVDDNKNNRLILRLMVEEFAQNNSCKLAVSEAEDGQIAVDLTQDKHYDIIFMDIMMPNMDGLTATKFIHRAHKTSMIIAVSAVEDDERKKVILSNGAEDYLSKPLNGDIFSSRMTNYVSLIESRNHRKLEQKEPHNLFTNAIRSFYLHFYAEDEDQISEFWEYYLQDEALYEGLSDVIRLTYSVGIELLNSKNEISIYEEQNNEVIFITLKCNKPLDKQWIEKQIEKNSFSGEFKINNNVLSIKLEKNIVKVNISPTVFIDSSVNSKKSSEPVAPQEKVIVEKKVFDILDPEDFQDLKEFINKLNSVLLIVGSSDIEEHEVDEIIYSLASITKTLSSYADLYQVSSSLGKLSSDIALNKANFIAKSVFMGALAKAFGKDLSVWFESIFTTGAPSINYLDDSIISNSQMISSFIVPEESAVNEEVDDLFF